MDLTKSLQEYFDELISNSPAPGSVNVSALCGALATSLGMMVCRLASINESYTGIEGKIEDIKKELTEFKNLFFELAEKDRKAFDNVIDAVKFARENDDEESDGQIQQATFETAEVPTELIKLCSDVLPVIQKVQEIGTKGSLSDTATAALLINAAAQGAYFNVLLACSELPNRTLGDELVKRSEILLGSISQQSISVVKSSSAELKS